MHGIPQALAPLTVITGLAYESIVSVRNTLYNSSILRRRRLRSPVVSIGNMTTGGTGKTPLVIFTARKVAELGLIPVVLSRGYGRPDSGTSSIVNPEKNVQDPVREMGDEPALIRRHVPEAWFGISRDRYSIGKRIEQNERGMVFILDDGFQHRQLHRDVDIVVIDSMQPLASNRIFPRGSLREPLSELTRCNTIVINGTTNPDTASMSVAPEIKALAPRADIFHCEQFIEKLTPYASWKNAETQEARSTPVKSAYLVAALGNPLRFQTDVLKLGIRVSGSRFYKDHHRLQLEDWSDCAKLAYKSGAEAIITTEKDAVKISEPPDCPLLVSVQATRLFNEAAYIEILHRCINPV